ncbi:MAG: hypothetical protein JWO33_2612 [Caulobacteraceae bacterium]|nr:hypothetical protein [Caulobacteraceae bacterium]
MTTANVEVRSSYLTQELVRVEFANSMLVSDHPVFMGGSGRGPSPGAMMLAALTSSGVLAARRQAAANGGGLQAARAAANARYDRETVVGHMPTIVTTGQVYQQIELFGGAIDDLEALRPAIENCAVARTLREGLELDEEVILQRSNRPRLPVASRNEVLWANETPLFGMAAGQTLDGPAPVRWSAVATDAGEDNVLVDLPGAMMTVSRVMGAPGGPSPAELMAAALSTCTAIFVARNAAFRGIPLEAVDVSVRLETDAEQTQPIRRMTKTAILRGDLTDDEFAQCKFFADFCAIGNSMKRGMPIADTLSISLVPGDETRRPALIGGLGEVAAPVGAECVDGTCCIP